MCGAAKTSEMLSFCQPAIHRSPACERNICRLSALFGHIAADKLETLCFSPLSFKVRSALCLPQGFRGVPHHQDNAETYGRTEHTERKAIIWMLSIHIYVCSSSGPNLAQTIGPNHE
jgi:hypothetical protein